MSDYDPNVIGSGTTWYITDPTGAVYTTDADYNAAHEAAVQTAITNQASVAPSSAVFGGTVSTPTNAATQQPAQTVNNPVVIDTTKTEGTKMTPIEQSISAYLKTLPWGGVNDKISGAKLAQKMVQNSWTNQQVANASIGTAQDWVAFWARIGITNPENVNVGQTTSNGISPALMIGGAAALMLVLMG